MIHQLTHIPIFNRSVFFCGNCSADEASDFIYKFEDRGHKLEFSPGAEGGCRDYGGDVYVWVKDLSKASVVSHELVHTAITIMDICGIPLSHDTEELLAYLVGWLKINVADEVFEKYDKENNKESKK